MGIVERSRYRKLGRALHGVSPSFGVSVQRATPASLASGIVSEAFVEFRPRREAVQMVWIAGGLWSTRIYGVLPTVGRRAFDSPADPPPAAADPLGWVLDHTATFYRSWLRLDAPAQEQREAEHQVSLERGFVEDMEAAIRHALNTR